jgi:hypothetical protein
MSYAHNKYVAEQRAKGLVEYASVVIRHENKHCTCGGANINCRFVTNREWRKPTPVLGGENDG